MKNREKYAKELIEIRNVAIDKKTNEVVPCREMKGCIYCLLNCKNGNCSNAYKDWLDKEYIKPRIEFKPMEIVEVSNNEETWELGYFKEYLDSGKVKAYMNTKKGVSWTYDYIRKVVQNDRSN